MNPSGMMFKVFAFGGSVVGPFIILLLLSVFYLIALKIMKGQFDFTNILNVVGLAMLSVQPAFAQSASQYRKLDCCCNFGIKRKHGNDRTESSFQ